MKSFSIKYLFILLTFIPVFAFAYTNLGKPTGFVNDFANIFLITEKRDLENKLLNFEKETGVEVSVVSVNNLGGDYIENYAVKLFEEWGIGKKGQNNGLLILISKEDREIRIEVGYGLEGFITDALSNNIINKYIVPAFKEGNYGIGISSAIDEIIKGIKTGDFPIELKNVEKPKNIIINYISDFFWFIVFGIMWAVSAMARSKSFWAGGVLGGIVGVIAGFVSSSIVIGAFLFVFFGVFGLFFDYVISKTYEKNKATGKKHPWWIGGGGFGGGHGGGFGGGFGGFGGGMSGGGGSSGRW